MLATLLHWVVAVLKVVSGTLYMPCLPGQPCRCYRRCSASHSDVPIFTLALLPVNACRRHELENNGWASAHAHASGTGHRDARSRERRCQGIVTGRHHSQSSDILGSTLLWICRRSVCSGSSGKRRSAARWCRRRRPPTGTAAASSARSVGPLLPAMLASKEMSMNSTEQMTMTVHLGTACPHLQTGLFEFSAQHLRYNLVFSWT